MEQIFEKNRRGYSIGFLFLDCYHCNSDEDAELTCLNLGSFDFIRKPYNADIVKGRVDNVIKLKESTLMLAAVEHDELTGLYTRQVFLHYAKGDHEV